MDASQIPVLGIDLGGTKIGAALVKNHQVVGEAAKVPTPKGPEKIIAKILELVEQFKKEELVLGVGIATAGIVDPKTGAIVGSTGNLPGWEGTALKSVIQGKTALATHVENDANAAAFGEVCASKALQDKVCVLAVTLGTGIGGGIILNGDVYRGAHFAAGEIGHIKVSLDNRRRCTCGLWDCWEAYGSGTGMVNTGLEMLQGVTPEQSAMAAKKNQLTTRDIITAAKNEDLLAQRVIDKWHEHVASGLASLCHTLDPDVLVVSGGMSQFVDYEILHDLVADRTLPRIAEKLEIHRAQLAESAGIIGAAELVRQEIIRAQVSA